MKLSEVLTFRLNPDALKLGPWTLHSGEVSLSGPSHFCCGDLYEEGTYL